MHNAYIFMYVRSSVILVGWGSRCVVMKIVIHHKHHHLAAVE
jgi:hypothetical protein